MSENSQDQAGTEKAASASSTMRWYVVHVYSGMEKSVRRALMERIERMGMTDQFGEILVPTEEVVEVKGGQKSVTERRFFPGYILVEMEMTDETWHLVRDTGKVTGFVGGKSNKPTPIPHREMEKLLQQMQDGVAKPVSYTHLDVYKRQAENSLKHEKQDSQKNGEPQQGMQDKCINALIQ